jgi:hypothetical protein
MEWLLQKAIETSGESYSPQQTFEILNAHSDAIRLLTYAGKASLILWLALAVYSAISNLRLGRRLKKIEE